jgi:hypothetical protein
LLDQGITSAIPQPSTPFGGSIGQNPFGGGTSLGGLQNNIFGNSGISSPGIQ